MKKLLIALLFLFTLTGCVQDLIITETIEDEFDWVHIYNREDGYEEVVCYYEIGEYMIHIFYREVYYKNFLVDTEYVDNLIVASYGLTEAEYNLDELLAYC